VAAVLVALAAVLVYERLSHDTQGAVEPFAIVLCFYTLARREVRRSRRGRLAVLIGCALAVAAAIDADQPGFSVVEVLLTWVPLAVLPAAAGLLVERHRVLNARLAGTAARLHDEQLARAEQAKVLERNRVARELHDVVAHSVSVMVVQAGAARTMLTREPDRSTEALLAVEGTGREALTELRRLLGLLTETDAGDGPNLAPQPGLDQLDRLVERVRQAGLAVDLEIVGAPRPLPPGLDLTAYRILQEALTNALKYASGAHAQVRVTYDDCELRLDVLDNGGTPAGDAAGAGRGLLGMHERVAIFGGQLETGPRAEGGFAVRARIPLQTA
jgi:signal transduction histidine kinase